MLCIMGGRLWFLGHTRSSYTCTGSALDVMDYGLAKAKTVVRYQLLGRHLCYGYLQDFFAKPLSSMFRSVFFGEDPVSDLFTRAMGSTLCVMGDRLQFFSHACSSYTCTGSALDVMEYGLAEAKCAVMN